MTDKQIIIDGVDVSGCPYYIDSDGSCSSHDCECIKCVHNECFYKDYKAKEQECEELKEEIKKHNDDMFKNPPEKRFYCKGCTLPYISKKLKQTLTEIKEIVKNGCYDDCGMPLDELSIILQKISEVEE